jgi:hypothetical protein
MGFFRRALRTESEVERLEDRRRTLARVTGDWLALVREMEANGETSDPRYERYFQAYLDARAQVKRVDLELFNYRHGLVG